LGLRAVAAAAAAEGAHAPPVRMIKLTPKQEITPYQWVHPDEER
jgi:hypothetical protein